MMRIEHPIQTGAIIGAILGVVLYIALPANAWDPRCEDPRHAGRAECQIDPPTTTTTTIATTSTSDGGTTTTTIPSTTTSQPPTTSTTVPGSDGGSAIAGLGCSNTKDALSDPGGYLDQSDQDNLIVVAAGGHTVGGWANNKRGSWDSRYLGFRPAAGYDGVWFHLCERAKSGLTKANIVTVLENIWVADPGIPVWLSPMNTYSGVYCSVTDGNSIAEQGDALIDELATEYGNVHRGPDTGPLTGSMVRRDDCHPNSAGVALMGGQIMEFFDG